MKDHLVPLTCPKCGAEDQAFASDLSQAALLCDVDGVTMERDDGQDGESNDEPAALRLLCEQTGTESHEWDEFDGPTTGVGVERYYAHVDGKRTAYTCDDQGQVTVSVSTEDDA